MKNLWSAAVLVLTVALGGCAGVPQAPVSLPADYLTTPAKTGRLGVVVAELPKVDTRFPGANCLLCLAVASGVHSKMTDHVRTLGTEDIQPLGQELTALLQGRGVDAVLIGEPLKVADLPDFKSAEPTNFARKDFTAFRQKHQLDRLLVVQFDRLGVDRAYASYVPTDVPRAVVGGVAYIVDLRTHRLDLWQPLGASIAAEGAWDEPPSFPGVSNAYFQAVARTLDQVKQPFAK